MGNIDGFGQYKIGGTGGGGSTTTIYTGDSTITGDRNVDANGQLLEFTNLQSVTMSEDSAVTNESTILNLQSTSKGFLQPKMTGAQVEAIATPPTGLQVYATSGGAGDVTQEGWWGYDGTNWVNQVGSSGKMVSTASFQGWKESPTGFGSPMATWGAGGSGVGGVNDLGFWVAPFDCTVENFSARWGHNSAFVNGGNNPIIGLYKITNAAWTGILDIGNPASWGSALQTITIPASNGSTTNYWKLTSTEASLSLSSGDAIAIFMDVTPTGGSGADSVIWLFVNYTYS